MVARRALLAAALAVVAGGAGGLGCRGILGIDTLADPAAVDAAAADGQLPGAPDALDDAPIDASDSAVDAADREDSEAGADAAPTDGASDVTRDVDRAWAAWPLPAESPLAANYSVNGGTVTDGTTHLIWERTAGLTTRDWQQARDYCDVLTLDNQTDWRLPKRIELWSIVDFGKSSPAINPVAFPQTPPSLFWSDSLDAANSPQNPTFKAWVVAFDDGRSAPIVSSDPAFVRCVRGG